MQFEQDTSRDDQAAGIPTERKVRATASDSAQWKTESMDVRIQLAQLRALRKVIEQDLAVDGDLIRTLSDSTEIAEAMLEAVEKPASWWTYYFLLQQRVFEQRYSTVSLKYALMQGTAVELRARLYDYVVRATCNRNPWTRVYQTLTRATWEWNPDTPRLQHDELDSAIYSYMQAPKDDFDGPLMIWLHAVKLISEQVEEFYRQAKVDDEFTKPASLKQLELIRRYIDAELAEKRRIHDAGPMAEKRRWLTVRVCVPLGGIYFRDVATSINSPQTSGHVKNWARADYSEMHELISSGLNGMGLLMANAMKHKQERAPYRPKGQPAVDERVDAEMKDAEDEAQKKPCINDYMVAMDGWTRTAPSESIDRSLKLPAYATGNEAQALPEFLEEIMTLSLFANFFDIQNRLDVDDSFLMQYVRTENDLASPEGRQRWSGEHFKREALNVVRMCPFILIGREGFTIVGLLKRSKPMKLAMDAILAWLQAMYREQCFGTLHNGKPLRIK